MFIRTLILLLCLCSGAFAGGRGGHNTTFDPNSFGGGWTTVSCTGNAGADVAAIQAWQAAAQTASPAIKPLRLVGQCNLAGIFPSPLDGIKNVVWWAYGASITPTIIGPQAGIGNPFFINSVSANSTSVTLQTIGDASNFTVGRWALVGDTEVQYPDCGSPPNLQRFDYVLVTSIVGAVISFSPPLTNPYDQTRPLVCGDGPAAIFPLAASWDTNVQIFGLTIITDSQISIRGRTIQLVDCALQNVGPNGNVAPTLANSISISGGFVGTQEIDKLIGTISYNGMSGGTWHWLIQSASIKQLNITSSTVAALVGTPLNASIINSTIPILDVGPFGYGSAQSILLDGVTTTSGGAGWSNALKSATSYSGGTISMPLTDPNIGSFVHTGAPGFKYVLGDFQCLNCGSPTVAFTITNIRIDASNYYWDTNLGSTPTSTCSGVPCPLYESFGAQTIKQINSPAGSANLTQYAAP